MIWLPTPFQRRALRLLAKRQVCAAASFESSARARKEMRQLIRFGLVSRDAARCCAGDSARRMTAKYRLLPSKHRVSLLSSGFGGDPMFRFSFFSWVVSEKFGG